jgi:cellulose synthase/poly-beta-1,6-N-acetylglucosamine synthase-like glycosyltransferase
MDSNIVSSGVTVGICAYNEAMNIGKLLSNIFNQQELPPESEVIVVCSGCTDNTVPIVQEFAEHDPRVHVYIEDQRRGKASAINQILQNAKGKAIIFISADTLPNEGCFRRLISKLNNPNVGIVCGNPVPVNSTKTVAGKVVHLLWSFHGYVFTQLNDAGLARHATEIFCIRKNITASIPLNAVNDDAYLALEAKKKGWLIKFEPPAQVLICGPKTVKEYFQQRRRVIYGHYQVKKMTGASPQHLMHLLPVYPTKVLGLCSWLFKTQYISTLTVFIIAELAANFVAIGDTLLKKNHYQWLTLTSTKSITPTTDKLKGAAQNENTKP